MTHDKIAQGLRQLGDEWPVSSITEDVMARVRAVERSESPRRPQRRRALWAAALAAASVGLGLTWIYLASTPTTLLAAVQDGVMRSRSAHLVVTQPGKQGDSHRAEGWYRRDEGFRLESLEGGLVDDGRFEWSWATPADKNAELIVIRQPSNKVSFTRWITQWLSFPDVPSSSRTRLHAADRVIAGVPCQALILTPSAHGPVRPSDVRPSPVRAIVLADAGQRVHQITIEAMKNDTWQPGTAILIEYDAKVPRDRVMLQLPERARVIDAETAFTDRYPLERALACIEIGGLLFGVHDIRPLKDGAGLYVVTSVRGTPEYLKKHPPAARRVNMNVPAVLDVALQPHWQQLPDGCDRLAIADATREGVGFSWWLFIPGRSLAAENGTNELLPGKSHAARPAPAAGKATIPLEATYLDKAFRDQNGVMQGVFKWTQVPLPPGASPETLEQVANRARRDILVMVRGNLGGLSGVAPETPREPPNPRAISRLEADRVTDAEFAAAIQRGLDDFRTIHELQNAPPS